MALLSTLVERIADVEGIDKVNASGIARYLREAGHISQAGRGRGAAHMTIRDAAHLLIGLNVARTAKSSPDELQHYCSLKNSWNKVSKVQGVCRYGNKLIDDLQKLIELCQDENFCRTLSSPGARDNNYEVEIFLSFYWPDRIARISIQDTSYDQNGVPDTEKMAQALYGSFIANLRGARKPPDRSETITITHMTFRAIAETLKN